MFFTNSSLTPEDQLGTQECLCEVKRVRLPIIPLDDHDTFSFQVIVFVEMRGAEG